MISSICHSGGGEGVASSIHCVLMSKDTTRMKWCLKQLMYNYVFLTLNRSRC